ncbi:MAG: zinc-ribbon domain-containing protein [Promethearchaeota archaeon]
MSENFPHMCIKCKRKDIDIEEYKYVITKKTFFSFFNQSKLYSSRELKLPVCKSCKRDLEKFRKYHNHYEGSKYYLICSICLAIILWFVIMRFVVWIFLLAFLISILVSIVIIVIIIIRFTHPNRIDKYIDVKKGQVKIRDQEFLMEMETHLISEIGKLREEEKKPIYCPKCGAKRRISDDFCNSCGKDLRGLREQRITDS